MNHRDRLPANRTFASLSLKVLGLLLLLALLPHLPIVALAGIGTAELGGRVNINNAILEELTQLPFIGENKAGAIMEFRRKHGPIRDISVLLDSGTLGQKTYEAIKPYVTLTGPSDLHYIGRDEKDNRVLSTDSFRTRAMTGPETIRPLPDQEYYRALLAAIDNAEHRIDIAMYLFKITDLPENRPLAIVEKLIDARQRGVQVNVLLEDSGYDEKLNNENAKTAAKLRDHGITVDFDSARVTTHAKIVVIDERYVFIGSHNFTHAALTDNHEFSLLIDSRGLARQTLNYMNEIKKAQRDQERSSDTLSTGKSR